MQSYNNKKRPASSLSLFLQVNLHYYWYYAFFYYGIIALFYIYKDFKFDYPTNSLIWEIFGLIFLFTFDCTRLFLGSKGNKLHQTKYLLLFLVFSAFSALGYVFYLEWQTYVLYIDHILSTIAISLLCLQSFLAILVALAYIQSGFATERHLH